MEGDLCHYRDVKDCKLEDGNTFCNATLRLIAEGKAVATDAGELKIVVDGAQSCHRLRVAMGDYPADQPLVSWSSAASKLNSGNCDAILLYLKSTQSPVLEPYLEELRAALSSSAPSSTAPAATMPARSVLPPLSQPAREAADFAAAASAALGARAASASVPAQQPPAAEPLPAGCERRADGTVVVRLDAPSYAVLAAATQQNKKGTKGARLPQQFEISRARVEAVISVAGLWAALRSHGGLHLVRNCSARSLPPLVQAP